MARRFHRVRHHAGRAMQGWKGSAISVASGAAAGLAAPYVISSGPAFLQSNWYAMPAAIALVGHFLQRKNAAVGGALMGVAGYWAYSAFQAQPKAAAASPTATGFIDAGAITSYNDNIATDAAPSMGTAQAAMLYGAQAMGFAEAGDVVDAYGLQD